MKGSFIFVKDQMYLPVELLVTLQLTLEAVVECVCNLKQKNVVYN